MDSTKRPARRIRTAIAGTVAAGAGLASLLGVSGVANAGTAATPNGYVVTDSCTSVSGKITYSPGLRTTTLKQQQGVLTGTVAGCSDIFSGAIAGSGTITAVLSGNSSVASENFTGTFTVNWPAGSGFNPSNGSLSVTEANGVETVSGTVTSGFDTGSAFGLQYVITGHTGRGTWRYPVKSQTYTNTQSLTLARNTG